KLCRLQVHCRVLEHGDQPGLFLAGHIWHVEGAVHVPREPLPPVLHGNADRRPWL
ncbi:hypothetical protein IWW38_004993, partial [Coemansia aciculifera]